MSTLKWFIINVNPEPWAIGPVGVSRRNGKLIPYVGRNAQLAAYQEAVREDLGPQELMEGKFHLSFIFFRNRAEYETPQARTHRKHEADLTNLQKATEDALQGVLFKNDKDVIEVHSIMAEQGPDVTGRILLSIYEDPANFWSDQVPMWILNKMDEQDEAEQTQLAEDRNVWPPR